MRNKCSILALILPSAEVIKVAEAEDGKLLPTVRALTRVRKRAAKRSEISWPVIDSIEALLSKLPDEVSMVARGGVRLEWARIGHAHKDSFIVFATSRQFEFMRNAKILCLDGTFDSTPAPFRQILVVNAVMGDHSCPCAHLLLSSKCMSAYSTALCRLVVN